MANDNEHGTDRSTAGLSAERIGRNESVFRAANERIDDFAARQQTGNPTPFICECADTGCHEAVFMTRAEYAVVREDARSFLCVPGHQASEQGWGRVVAQHESYLVVRNLGPAGEVAEQLEGSSDPATAFIQVDEQYRRPGPA